MSTDLTEFAERDNRWLNIRKALEKNNLDAIVIVSDGHLERRGAIRYVTNGVKSIKLWWHYVVFPQRGNAVAINVKDGWIEDKRFLKLRGSWVPESEPYAIAITDVIKELNIEKGNIGLEGDFLPLPVHQKLTRDLPKAKFKLTSIIDNLRKVKSPYEINLVEKGVQMMDEAFSACLSIAKVGISWNDITSEICRTLYKFGAEDIGGYQMPRSVNMINSGDSYNFYPEVQAKGGYWIQMGRILSFGEPSRELRDAWELNMKAQERGIEKLRVGNRGVDVMQAINETLKGSKYTGDARGSGHAIGLGVIERPYISFDEEMVFEPGMIITVHPVFSPLPDQFEANADMFVITNDRPRRLSLFSSEIKIIR